jgi:hypothetical protein
MIRLDYRMGPEWNPASLKALFECLYQLQQIAPTAQVGLPEAEPPAARERFASALQHYHLERLA